MLDSLDIEYGIAGSFASSQYGEPRQTLDVDLTLHLQPVDAERFARAFDAIQMAADAYAIRETYTYTAPLPFGVIDYANGWKADCYFLRSTAYDRAAFARRLKWPFAEAWPSLAVCAGRCDLDEVGLLPNVTRCIHQAFARHHGYADK